MIKVENIETWGFEHAIRGMRNPMNSWAKSDSLFDGKNLLNEQVIKKGTLLSGIGKKDMELMQKLYKAGVSHRTYARMIEVWMDVTAPLYWWKEADRYSVGKAQISTSTMHSIHKKPFELDDFSHEYLIDYAIGVEAGHSIVPSYLLQATVDVLNLCREKYLETEDKKYWYQMIQLLPSSYNQKRTIMMSYEVVFKIIHERSGHKLKEWGDFVQILKELPYIREIIEENT